MPSLAFVAMLASLAALSLMLAAGAAWAADGGQILKEQCAECHALQVEEEPKELEQMWSQKGPSLASAGVKYKSDWVAQWLQEPTPVRPAGVFFANHIKAGEENDVVVESTLAPHMRLPADKAGAVAESLMELKAREELLEAGVYQPGKISLRQGEMLFDKFRGCLACHQIEPGYGGVSGPEVYTATKRLQEDYIISYINNPQSWTPTSIMPRLKLKDRDLQNFVHYFHALAEEGAQ